MWHATQLAPVDVALWKWCVGVAYFSGRWQRLQMPSGETRTFIVCASWQSVQVTPPAYILLWPNEAYS